MKRRETTEYTECTDGNECDAKKSESAGRRYYVFTELLSLALRASH